MNPLDFLKQKLNQGLSDVENWGSDAGNAVTGAIHDVFHNNNQSSQPQAPQAPQNTSGPLLNSQSPLSLQNQQPQQQQNPMLKMNFGQPQAPTQQQAAPVNTPLNTKLVNFNNPQASIKTNNLPGSFNATPQQAPQPSSDPVGKFLAQHIGNPLAQQATSIAKNVSSSPLASGVKLGLADITGNQQAASNASQQLSQSIGIGTPKIPVSINVKGKNVPNPAFTNTVSNTVLGAGEAGLTPEGNVPFGKADQAVLNQKLAAGEGTPKYEQSPKEQMAQFEKGSTPLNPSEINTARNPYKANIPVAEHGDYGQVISNEQAASKPIQFAGDRWTAAMQKLNPDEQSNFWRSVEKPGDPSYSPELSDAIDKWRQVDDKIHGTSQELGGNTNYLTDHALHPWNLPEGFGDHVVNGGDPDKFPGINNLSRIHRTIAEGEAAGLKLGDDPIGEGQNYIGASASLLKRRAIVKSLAEADGNEEKTQAFDIGGGNSIPISDKAAQAVRGLQRSPASKNPLIVGARTANTAVKSSILSLGQFHPINISALRAGPTLALPKPSTLIFRNAETHKLGIDPTMSSHPIRAVKGVFGSNIRGLLPGGKQAAEDMKVRAAQDGMDIKAAKIGAPYGAGGFDSEGSLIKGGVGHQRVFDIQMPMMHDQVVRSVVSDLEKRGISLDSAEARTAGKAANNLMGFVNSEAQKIPPKLNRSLGDWLLAKQFTASKFSQTRTAITKGGVGGAYARGNVVANVAATTAIIAGLGYAFHQKSDNVKDMLLRALVNPGVPSPNKDAKGNTIDYRTPGTDTSDIAKLLGISLVRNSDGHLGVTWKPGNMPSTVEDFLRARLSPFASAGVKLGTNTSYANKPMFDPNAPAGTKAIQGATSIATGLLPIGLQGAAYTPTVKNMLPGSAQAVLNAQTPGTNPLVKSVGSSFGLTPSTDVTTGKGLATNQFYSAGDTAKSGLNRQAAEAIDRWNGSKKNPVTGAYDIQPNVNDTRDKAVQLLDNPAAIDHLIQQNQTLKSEGQKTDPLWSQSKDKITAYLQYQAMPPGGPDQVNWRQNNSWYDQGNNSLYQQRNNFFSSLPPGDPNKPAQPIQYPLPDATTAQDQNAYFSLYSKDPAAAQTFLQSHQDVQDQMDKQAAYTNELRQAEGYGALRTYPKPSPYVQNLLNSMTGMTSKQKAGVYNDPQVAAWSQADAIYNLTKGAGLAQIQGNSLTSKDLKASQSLQYDIMKNPDGSLSLKYGDAQGGTGGTALQPGAVSAGVGIGSGSKKNPLVPLPKIKKLKQPKMRKMRKAKGFRAPHIKTATRVKIQSPGIQRTQVARPTAVVKLAA